MINPAAPNAGRTSCSKDTTILPWFFRATSSGLRNASNHSEPEPFDHETCHFMLLFYQMVDKPK
jgi:hypothetical protein